MPKGNPGKVKPGQRDKAIERTGREADLETLAAVWPKLMRALDNLPPTPAEIMRVRLGPGPPPGFRFLPKVSIAGAGPTEVSCKRTPPNTEEIEQMGEPRDELLRIHNEKSGGRNRAIDRWMKANPDQVERFINFVESWIAIKDEVGPKPMALQSLLDALLLDDSLNYDVEGINALRSWVREEYPDA